ncbi:MAG: glycosyltransferase family 4 protein [bacterium]|nr:glycosyltransferase family 4 protein [bacterium]
MNVNVSNNIFEPIKKILSHSPEKKDSPTSPPSLEEATTGISTRYGTQAAYNALLRAEVAIGSRKPTMAIYDHTSHLIGGGQKYGFTVANALKDVFDITLIANREITHKNILDWYHLDLSNCKIKIIPIPFFKESDSPHLDPGRVTARIENPFHIISRESGNYDFFINNSMNEKVYPLSNVSALICHFPERRPKDYFYADQYTHVIYNSRYTAGWIEKKWKFTPHKHIYPPVDMAPGNKDTEKENIILSVARFEEGGSKKQMEMVRTFLKLNRRFPELMNQWRLVLAGGSGDPESNGYLKAIKRQIEKNNASKIQLMVNCPGDALKELYGRASVFWHLCGLDQTDPALVEHFGMTIVEAMQNGLVPIVFDGGGQREIVEQDSSGFRVASTAALMAATLKLVREPGLRKKLGANAIERSQLFSRETFEKRVREFFSGELRTYSSI